MKEIAFSNIWKNSIFIFFSQFIRLLTNFLIFIVIARLYGPEELGQFSVAFTIANICIIIADFGFDVLLATEIAKNLNNAKIIGRKYFSLKLIFIAISLVIMISTSSVESLSENSRMLIYALSLYVILTTIINFFYAIFRGFQKFEYETKVSFVNNFSLLIFLLLLGFLKVSITELMGAFVLSRVLGFYFASKQIKKIIGASIIKIDYSDWKFIVGKVLVFGIHFLFGNLFFQLDTVLLGIWDNDYSVGIYQSAFKIMLLVLIVPDIAVNSLLPILSRFFENDSKSWEVFSKLLYKILLMFAMPVAVILFFFPQNIIELIYGGDKFNDAIPLLKVFAIIVLVRFVAEPFALMLTTSNRQIVRMIIVIIATFISTIVNYFVIPAYGYYGASLVSLGINILVAVFYFIPNIKCFINWNIEFKTLLLIFLTLFFAITNHYLKLDIWFLIIFSSIYIIISYFFYFTQNEKKMFTSNFLFINK